MAHKTPKKAGKKTNAKAAAHRDYLAGKKDKTVRGTFVVLRTSHDESAALARVGKRLKLDRSNTLRALVAYADGDPVACDSVRTMHLLRTHPSRQQAKGPPAKAPKTAKAPRTPKAAAKAKATAKPRLHVLGGTMADALAPPPATRKARQVAKLARQDAGVVAGLRARLAARKAAQTPASAPAATPPTAQVA